MDALVLSTARLNGFVVVSASGEVDLIGKPLLYECVQAALQAHPEGLLVIDLSAVSFMDAQGLSALVMSRQHALHHQRTLALAAPSAAVRRLLQITGLSRSFPLMASPKPEVRGAATTGSAGLFKVEARFRPEVEPFAQVELELAVQVQMGPEQGGQSTPVGVGEHAGPVATGDVAWHPRFREGWRAWNCASYVIS